jgi:hypothetical protein
MLARPIRGDARSATISKSRDSGENWSASKSAVTSSRINFRVFRRQEATGERVVNESFARARTDFLAVSRSAR